MFVDANGINRRLESAETLEAALAKALVKPAVLPTHQCTEALINRILHELRLASLRNKFTKQSAGNDTRPSTLASKFGG